MKLGNFSALILLLMLAGCTNTDQQEFSWTPHVDSGDSCLCTDVMDRVFFGYDRSELTAEARATLDKQAAWLKKYPRKSVTVEGHADERGTREYNLALGERRANAVKNYLAAAGVPKSSLHVISYGKERPQVLGANEAAWAQNRRGVTVVGE